MPIYRSRRKTYRRQKSQAKRRLTGWWGNRLRHRRRVLSYNIKTPVTRIMNGVPERLFTKLRYVDCMNWTVTGSVLSGGSSFAYFQSSIYAPRNSGGHQPLYRDQWANMFSKYRVYGIKYHITCVNRATNESFWFGVRHQEDTTTETSIQTILERNDAKVKMGSSVNNSNNLRVIKGYMDVAKTLGKSKSSIRAEDNFSADIGSNPNNMAYLFPYILSNLASGSATFEFTFRLTYYVELFNQVAVSAS